MNDKIEEIQKYLRAKGIAATETSIIDASIKIATRWGGNAVFLCEFKKGKRDGKEKDLER